MSWRPDGWENPYSDKWEEIEDSGGETVNTHEAFEAGADAMYEGLMKLDGYVGCSDDGEQSYIFPAFGCPCIDGKWVKGKFVFIPEEVKE